MSLLNMLQSKHSEAFLAVAETGSFEQAAQRLNITASAVTLRLQSLEKNLGHLLIVRERPCKPTQVGQSLLHFLQHSKLLEHNFLQNLTGQTTSSFYQVNIATNADSLATWLLPVLNQCLIDNQIVIHFQVDDQSQTHHLLEAGLVNACVTTEAHAMNGCSAEYLGTMHYHFVATPEFKQRWFKDGVNRESIRLAPALIFNAKDGMHTDYILKNFGLNTTQYPHHFIPSSRGFIDAMNLGLGYGWLPYHQAKVFFENGSLIEVSQALRIELPLYWHHWKQQSQPLSVLTEVLIENAQKLLN